MLMFFREKREEAEGEEDWWVGVGLVDRDSDSSSKS